MPKVSVIIPVYNTEAYLAECLDSVLNQTMEDIEVICVNDGSDDGSGAILEQYKNMDPRVVVLDKPNGGQSSARNMGLSIAKGEYIQFLDSDDYIDNKTLEELYECAGRSGLDELFYSAEVFYETEELAANQPIKKTYYQRNGEYPEVETGRKLFIHFECEKDFKPSPCLQIIRKEFLTENKIRFTEGFIHEDDLFTMMCMTMAERAWVLPDAKYYQRRVRESSTMTDSSNSLRSAYGRYKVIIEMHKFMVQRGICGDQELYNAIINRLYTECDNAAAVLSDVENKDLMNFALKLDENERTCFLTFMGSLGKKQQRVSSLNTNLKRVKDEKNVLNMKLKSAYEEKFELSRKLKNTNEEKSELSRKLKNTYEEKSELSRKLKDTYEEKSELCRTLKNAYEEKSELNRKLKITYDEKAERGKEIKRLKEEIERLKMSRSYRIGRAVTWPARAMKGMFKL